jgi:DNA-binding winged helix-turn-helix (wHTH) protein/Tol biopolymer transport system component
VFEVDAHQGELLRDGVRVKLREQSFRVLLLLLENAGALVSREDLRKALWPSDTFVDFDHSLNAAVMRLRETLGDTADKPLYIETIPKHGYRFIAPLLPAPDSQTAGATIESPRSRANWRFWTAFSVAAAMVCAGIAFWGLHHEPAGLGVREYVQLTRDSGFKEVAAADATRIYVNLFQSGDEVVQMPLSGGELVPIRIELPGEDRAIPGLAQGDHPMIFDLSPDGSMFLCAGPGYSLWEVSVTGKPLRQLGQAVAAAWSPDGTSVVYAWGGDAFVTKSDGTGSRLLVSGKSFPGAADSSSDMNWLSEGSLGWSPDGSRIRFTRRHELWEVSPDGSGLHLVLPGWRPSSWKSSGRWTPDGEYYIFLSGEPNVIPLIAGNQLWALDERRSWPEQRHREPIRLTSGPTRWGHPVPSRDGNKIFARGIVLNGELIRFDARTQQWAPFLGGKSAQWVSFSPDHKSVAYVSFPEEVLYSANADGSGDIQLTDSSLAVKSTDWSPDGSQILINAQVGNGYTETYVVPAQGGPPRRLIPDDKEPEGDAHWAPDGKRMVFSNARSAWNNLDSTEIRIYDITSGQTSALPGTGEDFSPRWSPDGRYIATLTISEHKLRVFDLLLKKWSVAYEGFANYPVWSADSKYICFPELEQRVVMVPVGGGKPQFIAPLTGMSQTGSLGGWFGLDPNGAPLLLRDKGSSEVYALQLERK